MDWAHGTCTGHHNCCIYVQEVHEMTEKQCGVCTNIKVYDGRYRCMVCFKEFVVAEEEDAMNTATVAPAIARIQELETENQTLRQKVEALLALAKAPKNPGPVRKGYPAAMLEDEAE